MDRLLRGVAFSWLSFICINGYKMIHFALLDSPLTNVTADFSR